MIRSKIIVEWDKMKRREGIVYMSLSNRNEANGFVTFTNNFFVLDSFTERVTVEESVYQKDSNNEFILDEGGNKIPMIGSDGNPVKILVFKNKTQPFLKEFRVEYPNYKTSTFYSLFPSLKPDDYDETMIQQIDYNNSLPNNNNNYYWELTGDDMEVVTQAQLTALLTPTFTDI
jgi:hypothetical protein